MTHFLFKFMTSVTEKKLKFLKVCHLCSLETPIHSCLPRFNSTFLRISLLGHLGSKLPNSHTHTHTKIKQLPYHIVQESIRKVYIFILTIFLKHTLTLSFQDLHTMNCAIAGQQISLFLDTECDSRLLYGVPSILRLYHISLSYKEGEHWTEVMAAPPMLRPSSTTFKLNGLL